MLTTILRQLRRILLTALLGGLLGATLVRLGPGFGVDERELDNRLSQESHQAIRAERAADSNIAMFYLRYLSGLMHGDLGFSRSLNRPVSELLKERLPLTLGSLAYGVLGGVSLGLTLALVTACWRVPGSNIGPAFLAGACLALPAAVIALLFLWMNVPGRWAIALVVFPHVYRYAKNLLVATYQSPHVLAAQAKGLSNSRVWLAHVFAPAAPQLAALAGISVSLAFGASIPIEVISDTPGVGQLAWKAALDRDLPLLVNITVLVALMTLVANSLADLALAMWRPEASPEAA
ncbi:MAG TPA: ABC transporter permease [Bryobacteraceae bacterium]|jgi:peptide/nickel transport system permease protein|nr:ABC transporter permease [Bryobacteraceae bacterium]